MEREMSCMMIMYVAILCSLGVAAFNPFRKKGSRRATASSVTCMNENSHQTSDIVLCSSDWLWYTCCEDKLLP